MLFWRRSWVALQSRRSGSTQSKISSCLWACLLLQLLAWCFPQLGQPTAQSASAGAFVGPGRVSKHRLRGGRLRAATAAAAAVAATGEVDVAPLLERLLDLAPSGKVNVVQVGACDGDFTGSGSTDDPLQGRLKAEPRASAVLVEPNPAVFEALRRNVAEHFGEGGRVKSVNVAIAPDRSGEVQFFVVSPRFAEDHPHKAAHWACYQLSSMDREHVLKHHEHVGLSREAFEAYIEELTVPCLTPSDLLQEMALPAEAVDLLVVDAEGFDAEIVGAFLRMDGFDPKALVFEVAHAEQGPAAELLARLEARGYQVAPVRSEWRTEEAGDMVAFKPSLSLPQHAAEVQEGSGLQ